MRLSFIPAMIAVVSLSGCLSLPGITGPTAEQMTAITSDCRYQLGLDSSVSASDSAKLSDCINRSLIASGFAEPEPVLSAFELRQATAQQNAREMDRFCPAGAAVLYSGSTYCVGRK